MHACMMRPLIDRETNAARACTQQPWPMAPDQEYRAAAKATYGGMGVMGRGINGGATM
jgi:hypothetical protein